MQFTFAMKAINKTMWAATDLICDCLKLYQKKVLTLNYCNGKEFFCREKIALDLTAENLSAHPCHFLKQCLTKNINCLIGQYIPNVKDIDNLKDKDVAKII